MERRRLAEDAARAGNWKRWGPYLAERQWGTVREDYSPDGEVWRAFTHEDARSRAYRWGEDGLLGFTDRQCRLCVAFALWNGKDPFLKERLFGLTGPEGNHGEDVKEESFLLDATPTYSFTSALYKYPQAGFPYARLRDENARRGRGQPEFELADAGVFAQNRAFDVRVDTAKAAPEDVLVRVTVANRGPDAARLHLLPTVWFRNTWSWGRTGEEHPPRPRLERAGPRAIACRHAVLGDFTFALDEETELLFTENETNAKKLFGSANASPYVKDAFHEFVVAGRRDAVNPRHEGTKAAALYVLDLAPGGERALSFRLARAGAKRVDAARVFAKRRAEADAFYSDALPAAATDEERRVMRQACAGLLFNKQSYHFVVADWLDGDPAQPKPPAQRRLGRNHDWVHLYNRDVVSMPDKWEYPYYCSWDLAFHMLPFAELDPRFAKEQILLFLREWYMHPNGQIPAYEWNFSDVNPPVHAWAAWRVYKVCAPKGGRDREFLDRVFQKLLLNFTWWVNRKDVHGRHLFAGGFLGLDNIGIFDRSRPLPNGGTLEQADGTAWMGFYCATMLAMALELAKESRAAEDLASKFFEHFVRIIDAMNHLDGAGLWDEEDGFYYDRIHVDGRAVPLKVRSLVGLIPLVAVELLEEKAIERVPGFGKRLQWFLDNLPGLARHVVQSENGCHDHRLVAIASRRRLERILRTMLDEDEFLSPYGLRSVSRVHADKPFAFTLDGRRYEVAYQPGESDSGMFGGNSNWRGPIWFPINYLIVEALERYHHFYGDDLRVECPTGSGTWMNLQQVARELERRLASLFLPDASGARPCFGGDRRFRDDPAWRDLLLFHEYFHGDTGRGCGASHQTGWTALVVRCLRDLAADRPIPVPARRAAK